MTKRLRRFVMPCEFKIHKVTYRDATMRRPFSRSAILSNCQGGPAPMKPFRKFIPCRGLAILIALITATGVLALQSPPEITGVDIRPANNEIEVATQGMSNSAILH